MLHCSRDRPAAFLPALLAILIAGCATPGPSPTPRPSPGPPSAAASAVPPSAEATTPGPTSVPGRSPAPATMSIPAGALRSLPGLGPRAAQGPLVYGELNRVAGESTGDAVALGDLTSGLVRPLIRLAAGHALADLAATDGRVVWVETWRDQPSPPGNAIPGCVDAGKPLRWRIRTLVPGAPAQDVASGTNVRTAIGGECADVNPPVVAIDGDRLAYALEAATSASPVGNRIVVVSLASGSAIRTISTTGLVLDLRLSGTAIAYRECLPTFDDATVEPLDCRVMATASDDRLPAPVEAHASALALGGTRLAWVRSEAGDGSIFTSVLGSDEIVRVAVPLDATLAVQGARLLAASDGVVAWSVDGTEIGGSEAGFWTSRLAVWLPGDPSARLLRGHGPPDFVAVGGGWLVWRDYVGKAGGAPEGLYGVPLEALVDAAP